MYVDYEALKRFCVDMHAARELVGGTTDDESQVASARESLDADSVWARYANAAKLTTEVEERATSATERDAAAAVWESLGMEPEPALEVRSALEDCGSGVPDILREFYKALDAQVNKCNKFYEVLVDLQAKHLSSALMRIDVVTAACDAETPQSSARVSEVDLDDGASPTDAPAPHVPLRRHVRSGSATTASGTNLHELFKPQPVGSEGHRHETAVKAARAILTQDKAKSSSATTLVSSREKTVRALLHDVKEIYYAVCMIQNFSTLNAVAIRKITKKMDKEALTRTSGTYCSACDQLAFWPDVKESTFQCKTMIKLCESAFVMCHVLLQRVKTTKTNVAHAESGVGAPKRHALGRKEREALLLKLRETGRRIKDDGMKVNLERDSNGDPLLFFTGGFFWGIAIPALLIPIWYLVVACGLESTDETCRRELAAFVTLRGVLLIFGSSLLWGPAVYVWQRLMVHWELIFFGSAGKSGLRAEHAIIATVLPWLTFVCILTTSTVLWSSGKASTTWVKPLSMTLFVFFVVPVPQSWHLETNRWRWLIQPPMETRRFLFRHITRTISAPFTPVVFPDFFIADQLTSQSTAIADLLVTFGIARDTSTTRAMAATIPLWFRLAQCVRRARDVVVLRRGGTISAHILNAGKYSASILALWLRHNAARVSPSNHSVGEWIVAYVFTVVSVTYSLMWDYFCDWTIFAYDRDKRWRIEILPRRTLVKSHAVWTFAVVFNTLARSAALFAAVPGLPIQNLSTQVLVTALAALEVVRRSVWNVFRVENEHSSNCGSFRAIGDSAFDALEDPFVAHVDELSKELKYVPEKGRP